MTYASISKNPNVLRALHGVELSRICTFLASCIPAAHRYDAAEAIQESITHGWSNFSLPDDEEEIYENPGEYIRQLFWWVNSKKNATYWNNFKEKLAKLKQHLGKNPG